MLCCYRWNYVPACWAVYSSLINITQKCFFFLLFSTLPLPFSIASDMSWWIFCFWRKKFVFCSTTSQFSYSVVNTFPLLTVELMLLCSRFYFIYLVSVCVVIRVSNFWRCQSAVWINWDNYLKLDNFFKNSWTNDSFRFFKIHRFIVHNLLDLMHPNILQYCCLQFWFLISSHLLHNRLHHLGRLTQEMPSIFWVNIFDTKRIREYVCLLFVFAVLTEWH